jgi:hypothetical protein
MSTPIAPVPPTQRTECDPEFPAPPIAKLFYLRSKKRPNTNFIRAEITSADCFVCDVELVAQHPPLKAAGAVDRNLLVQYFSEAFCFADGEAYPIFGWLPDGTGELKDGDLDRLLTKRIQRTRSEWDNANLAPHSLTPPG